MSENASDPMAPHMATCFSEVALAERDAALRAEGAAQAIEEIAAALMAKARTLADSESIASGIEWALCRDLAARIRAGTWPERRAEDKP